MLIDNKGMTLVLSSARVMACANYSFKLFILKKSFRLFCYCNGVSKLSSCINTKTVPKYEVNKIYSPIECDAVSL